MADPVLDLAAFAPSSDPVLDLAQFAPAQKPSALRRFVADPALSLLKGAISVPEAAVGLADIPTLGGAGRAAEALGFRPKAAKQFLDTLYSPEQQQVTQEFAETQGFLPSLAKIAERPSVIPHAILESLPSIGAGGVVARGALAALPRLGFPAAAAIGEGAVSAGQTAEQVRQEAPSGFLTPAQAGISAVSGAVTGGVTMGGAALAQRFNLVDVDALVAGKALQAVDATKKGLTRRTVEGFATEGAEELLQSSQEQIAQNLALSKPLGGGVGQAAALGLMTGGILGGGVQALPSPRVQPAPAPAPASEPPLALPPPGPIVAGAEAGVPLEQRIEQAAADARAASVYAARQTEEERQAAVAANEAAVAELTQAGVAPDQPMTRQEFVKVARAEAKAAGADMPSATDLQPAYEQHQRAVMAANQAKLAVLRERTPFAKFPAAEAKLVVAPDQLAMEDISPAPAAVEAELPTKTRIAEPTILGEQPAAPAPQAVITPQEAEILAAAEKEAQDAAGQVAVQEGVQRERGEGAVVGQAPAAGPGDRVLGAAPGQEGGAQSVEVKVAQIKRQRGLLLSAREAKLLRDVETPAVVTPAVQTTPRSRARQFSPVERQENFADAYSNAVDVALAELVAEGGTTPQKASRAATILKRAGERAVFAKDDAAGTNILDESLKKALRGILSGPDVDTFRQRLADATQAAMPETLASRAATREEITVKGVEMLRVLADMVGMPKRLRVELAPRVSGGAGMIQYGDLFDTITLSLQATDGDSLAAHEGYHFLEKRALSAEERRVVARALTSGTRLHKALVEKAEAYDRLHGTSIADEIRAVPAEARAYGFEFWRRGELEAPGMLGRAWQKLLQTVERVKNYVDGLGFQSYEDIFEAARLGAYAQRDFSGIRELNAEIERSRAKRAASAEAFYSALAEAMPGLAKIAGKDGQINPAQAKSWLLARQKEGLFKAAEIDAVGLVEWLDLQKGKIPVDSIENFVRENGVQVRDVMLGDTSAKEEARALLEDAGYIVEDDNSISREDENGDVVGVDGWNLPTRGLMDAAALLQGASEGYAGGRGVAAPKFSSYQLPGGENYRELLLTLPSLGVKKVPVSLKWEVQTDNLISARLPSGNDVTIFSSEDGSAAELQVLTPDAVDVGAPQQFSSVVEAKAAAERMAVQKKQDLVGGFRSSHYDQPNILAHVRFNERTDADGKRVLFLEEIQSDWAQKGRKEGFVDKKRLDTLDAKLKKEGRLTPTEAEEYNRLVDQESMPRTHGGVPSAPFVTETKAWVALALKRMIRYAAENGFDRVAWTTGEQQAARYDLSKQVESVAWRGGEGADGTLMIRRKGGANTFEPVARGLTAADLADHIGKDAAEKLSKVTPDKNGYRTLSGLDLKVGGEGMKAFYDKIVPQVANEVLKKFGGGKVDVRLIEEGTDYPSTDVRHGTEPDLVQPGFDITPALKGEAMAGLPLFSRAATREQDAIADLLRRVQDGELQREQVNAALAKLLDSPEAQGLRERLAANAGYQVEGVRSAMAHGYWKWFASSVMLSRVSKGFANVFRVLTAYIQRKDILIARAMEQHLSKWVKGASRADKQAVSAALLDRTVRSVVTDSVEYHAIRDRLTAEQRAMFDQATKMIADQLDAELEADAREYRRKLANDEAFKEWYALRKTQVDQLKQNGYFPLRRYGDHVVHAYAVGADGKPITAYYSQHQHKADALRELALLKTTLGAEGLAVEYGFKHRAEYDGSISIGQFLDLAERHGVSLTQSEKERLGKALISADSTRRNRLFRREGIAGYSQDGMRALAEFAVTMANKIAYSELGEAINDARNGRQVDVKFDRDGNVEVNTLADSNVWEEDGPEAGFYRNVADAKAEFVVAPDARSDWSNKLRSLATIHFLGGSIAAGMVNISSLPVITLPWLSQHSTPGRALSGLVDGMRLATTHFKDIRDLPTLMSAKALAGIDDVEGLRHALQIAAQNGSLFDTEIYQMMGLSRGQEYSLSGRTQEAVKVWMTPFRLAEQFNRLSTFISAYKLAKDRRPDGGAGLDNEAAARRAQEAVDSTQYRYDTANRPALAQSSMGSLFFVFKSFPLFTMETMTFLAKESPRSAAMMLGMLVLMAGVEGLPFAEDLEDIIDVLAQRLFGESFNSKRWLRNFLKAGSEAVVGADLSHVLMKGALNSLTQLNIAGRVGLGNIIPGTRIGAADTDYRRAMDEILGPVGAMVTGVASGVDAITKGNYVEGLRQGLPLAAQNVVKGMQQFESGYAADVGGKKLIDVGTWESLWQTLGFTSAGLSAAYEADAIDRRTSSFYGEIKGQFTKDMVAAIRDGDKARAAEIAEAVSAWNQSHPDMPVPISPANLRRQVMLAGLPLSQRTLLTMPRMLRGQSEAAIGLVER